MHIRKVRFIFENRPPGCVGGVLCRVFLLLVVIADGLDTFFSENENFVFDQIHVVFFFLEIKKKL